MELSFLTRLFGFFGELDYLPKKLFGFLSGYIFLRMIPPHLIKIFSNLVFIIGFLILYKEVLKRI